MSKRILLPLFCFSIQLLVAQNWFSTGQSAELMVSGVDFNNTGGPLAFNHPNGLATDGTHFLLCDRFNNRVLVWNNLPASWDDAPDIVLGQPDFTSNNPGTAKNKLNWAGNVSVGNNGKLAVADTENDRILLWDAFPTENGEPADVSLFLPALSPPGSPLIYGWPWGVWTDGLRLAAVATTGGAILFWDNFPTTDNGAPDYVVKLPQFGTPRNISTDGSTYFFVGDHNAKVNGVPGTFFWNSYPSVDNQPYDFYRDEWIKGEKLPDGKLVAGGLLSCYVWNTMPTSATQNPDLILSPAFYKNGDGVDVAYAGGKLFVNNYNGNNVLVFNAIPTSSSQLPDFALGAPAIQAQTLDSIYYIQNPVPATDGTRLIVTSDFDRAIYIWDEWPTHSGEPYDHRILLPQNVHVWANTLFDNKFVIAARNTVSVWNDATQLSATPSVIFNNSIGTAQLNDITGVALDSQFFYLGLKNGSIHIWEGVPDNANTNPILSIAGNGGQLNFLHSDGEYLCAARPEPPAGIDIYKISELEMGITTPYKIINAVPQGPINQSSHAITFDGALALASRGNHSVLLWEHEEDWGDYSKMVVLGQPNANSKDAAIGLDHLFMPNALLTERNNLWVGEFKFSSRILKFSSGTTEVQDALVVEKSISLFPNPVAEHFTFEFEPAFSDEYAIELLDVNGRLLQRLFAGKLTAGEPFTKTFSVEGAAPPTGLSFLKISSTQSRGFLKVVR